jgi:hypothetical protein
LSTMAATANMSGGQTGGESGAGSLPSTYLISSSIARGLLEGPEASVMALLPITTLSYIKITLRYESLPGIGDGNPLDGRGEVTGPFGMKGLVFLG